MVNLIGKTVQLKGTKCKNIGDWEHFAKSTKLGKGAKGVIEKEVGIDLYSLKFIKDVGGIPQTLNGWYFMAEDFDIAYEKINQAKQSVRW